MKCTNNHATPAETNPATGVVTSQANAMFLNVLHDTRSVFDRAIPTHRTAPTILCVVLTGMPILLAKRIVNAVPSDIAKPLEKF